MRVASDEAIELARRLRSTGKSWDEILDNEESRQASLDMWLSSRSDRKRRK